MSECPLKLQPGDILGCYGTDAVSRAISLGTSSLLAPPGTRWAPSHVAIVADVQGMSLWCESTMLSYRPCLLAGEVRRGMQFHWPAERVADYVSAGGQVVLFRLSPIDALEPHEITRLDGMLSHFAREHATYDTVGALISGTRVVRRLTRLLMLLRHRLHIDQDSLFCSELIAAVLQRLCRMNRREPTTFSPGTLVRTLVSEGTYRRVGAVVPTPEMEGVILA